MLSTLIHTALFVALAARHVAAANLQIDTPTLIQCQDATLSYSGGQGGYGLYVVPSEEPCADSVVNIPEQNGTSYKWKVNIPANSKVEVLVEDSTGAEAWSGIVTVQNSTDSSCVDPKAAQALNAAVSSSAASSGAGSAPTPSTTLVLPTVSAPGSAASSAAAKTVEPAGASAGLANAASGDGTPPSSGSIPRAALPAGSLLAAAAFLLTLAHL